MSRTPRFTRFRQELGAGLDQIGRAFRHLIKGPPVRAPRPRPHHAPTIIVAHNFPQAREYARLKGLGGDWVYATIPEKLYGYHHVNLVLLDGWSINKDSAFIRAVEQLKRFNEAAGRQA